MYFIVLWNEYIFLINTYKSNKPRVHKSCKWTVLRLIWLYAEYFICYFLVHFTKRVANCEFLYFNAFKFQDFWQKHMLNMHIFCILAIIWQLMMNVFRFYATTVMHQLFEMQFVTKPSVQNFDWHTYFEIQLFILYV